jgi:antitoxin CcdA
MYTHYDQRTATMLQLFDETASKKATNLSINSDLLSKARELKINLSATLERALADELRTAERDKWLKSNKKAIDSLNELAERNGLFSDSYRRF